MKLAVVIVHYNASGDLDRCLASLATHAPSCPHAVVVVDNASRDEGLAAVQSRHPHVRWCLNRENVGYARGANQGMAAVSADYYLVLNPDVVAEAGALDALLAVADAHPRAGILAPQLLNEDGTIQESCRRFYTFRTLLLRRTVLGKLVPHSRTVDHHLMRDFDHRTTRPVDWALGGCLLVRREAIDRAGAMDERFFLYFEDVDWCYRMWQAGYEVLYTPDARFVHRHRRESAKGIRSRSFWYHLGSLISFYEKWGMLIYLLKKWREPLVVGLLWALDMAALVSAFVGAYILRATANRLFPEPLYPLAEYRPLLLYSCLLTTVTFLLIGRYRRDRRRRAGAPLEHLKQVGIVSLLLLASTYLSHQQVYSRAVLLLFVPIFALTTALGADLFRALRARLEHGYLSLDRTLLVGETARLEGWLARVGDPRRLGIDPVGFVTAIVPETAGAATTLPGGDIPWLGGQGDLVALVERYRISQVMLWRRPAPDSAEQEVLAVLRRRRIRLRWRVQEAWLLAAGAHLEEVADQNSAVLEPGGGSVFALLFDRLLSLLLGLVLLVLGAPFYLGLKVARGGETDRRLEVDDGWSSPVSLRVVLDGEGRSRALWWQWRLAAPLLAGRLSVLGVRPRVLPDDAAVSRFPRAAWWSAPRRPGLTGSWAVPASPANRGGEPRSLRAVLSDLAAVARTLLLRPGGLATAGTAGSTSATMSSSRPDGEVPRS